MNIRLHILLPAAAILAAACAPASQAQAEDRYEIDAAHTHVQFSIMRFGFNDVIGTFLDVKGVITLDQDKPEMSSVEVEIAMASVESGDATRNEHLGGAFWLNVEQHPAMSFKSTAVEVTGEDAANVTGDLTLLGVTKPVVLAVTLNKIGADPATRKEAVGFSATASLNRLDFGLETAEGLIGNDIAIRIETLAHKIMQ